MERYDTMVNKKSIRMPEHKILMHFITTFLQMNLQYEPLSNFNCCGSLEGNPICCNKAGLTVTSVIEGCRCVTFYLNMIKIS